DLPVVRPSAPLCDRVGGKIVPNAALRRREAELDCVTQAAEAAKPGGTGLNRPARREFGNKLRRLCGNYRLRSVFRHFQVAIRVSEAGMRPVAGWKSWALVFAILAGGFVASEAIVASLGLPATNVAVAQEEGADDAGGDAAPKQQKSYLMWFFGALGWRYTIAFLFLSFTFVAVLVMN